MFCALQRPLAASGSHTTASSMLRRTRGGGSIMAVRRSRSLAVAPRAVMENGPRRDIGERTIGTLPYLLPLLDAIPFGKFLFVGFPWVARSLSPLAPLAMVYNSFPLMPFLVFIGVYTGICNNQNFSKFVRVHAMQAVLLDILLIVPQIILMDLFKPPTDEFGMAAYVAAFNTIFLYVAVSAAYGMGSSMVGLTARVPLVAEAADTQINRQGPGGW